MEIILDLPQLYYNLLKYIYLVKTILLLRQDSYNGINNQHLKIL